MSMQRPVKVCYTDTIQMPMKHYRFYGWLHAFGQAHVVFENGPGAYPCAIVEDHTGRVHTVPAEVIQFTDKSEELTAEWKKEMKQ